MTRRAVASQAIVVYLYEVREMADDPLTIPPPPSQRPQAPLKAAVASNAIQSRGAL
jgi:hypothetical protein